MDSHSSTAPLHFSNLSDGVTGNFDVSVQSSDNSSFHLIHSKKVPLRGLVQDGFVDSVEKLERILRGIEKEGLVQKEVVDGALAGRTAFPRSISRPLGGDTNYSDSAQTLVQHWTSSVVPLVIFTKTWCNHCKRALQLMKESNLSPFIISMDSREDESEVQIALGNCLDRERKGTTEDGSGVLTVPQIFVYGISMGGADDLEREVEKMNSGEREDTAAHSLFQTTKGWNTRESTVDQCWRWTEAMAINSELVIGVEYNKFMGEMEGGIKVFRPPKRNGINKDRRPPL